MYTIYAHKGKQFYEFESETFGDLEWIIWGLTVSGWIIDSIEIEAE